MRVFHKSFNVAGTCLRATVCKAASLHRRARACPSPCLGREGNGLCLRAFFARVERSRGTGPRATVCKAVSLHRRARACPSPCLGRGNGVGWRAFFAQVGRSRGKPARMRVWHPRAPALRFARPPPFTVGRGPVPRRASIEENGVGWRAFFAQIERSRGTGPRATN